jgi:chorismate mutase
MLICKIQFDIFGFSKITRSTIVPMICKDGDDGNYGSSGMHDVQILQAMSKRIHYGKFVAEVKYAANPGKFSDLISKKNYSALWDLITDEQVEKKVLDRISLKALTYGHDPTISKDSDDYNQKYFINPDCIRSIYENIIIPFTKDVQVLYLLGRNKNV